VPQELLDGRRLEPPARRDRLDGKQPEQAQQAQGRQRRERQQAQRCGPQGRRCGPARGQVLEHAADPVLDVRRHRRQLRVGIDQSPGLPVLEAVVDALDLVARPVAAGEQDGVVEPVTAREVGQRLAGVTRQLQKAAPRAPQLEVSRERARAGGQAPRREHGVHQLVLVAIDERRAARQVRDAEVDVAARVEAEAVGAVHLGVGQGQLLRPRADPGDAEPRERLVRAAAEVPGEGEAAALVQTHAVRLDDVQAAVVVQARAHIDRREDDRRGFRRRRGQAEGGGEQAGGATH
jgi:hypothetical protein